uniref:tRNA-modifying protein YgfZ n=1 Tax=Thaumasiovibrio occultus TaxID=1891184 RepID=UPI000B357276|nr:tRNA-modifying protein YgfZ [Thaumasiovibrio occultus]
MSTWTHHDRFSSLPATLPLPALALHYLSGWQQIDVIGPDARSYLQGQLTCNVISLAPDSYTFAAHCDAKGKMHSVFRLFPQERGVGYIQRRSVTEKQTTELKKYAIFSKLEITPSERVILGISGENANAFVSSLFSGEGSLRTHEHGAALQVGDRWLLSVDESLANELADNQEFTLAAEALWDFADILAGIPRLDDTTAGEHIPQALNLQALDGISFNKGCYTGQETVARAKYRGINKRAMLLVTGQSAYLAKAGDDVERQVGENWRRGGTVIAAAKLENNDAAALVVLPNDLEADTALRFAAAPDDVLALSDLPYSLTDEA